VKNDRHTGAANTVETLAVALFRLAPQERATLAVLLLGQQPGQGECTT
jgi:hypothetical protein